MIAISSGATIHVGRYDPQRLLASLPQLWAGATLHLEGTSMSSALMNSLDPHARLVAPAMSVDDPNARHYVMDVGDPAYETLLEFANSLAAPEVADHAWVVSGSDIVLTAFDLGDGEIVVRTDSISDIERRILDSLSGSSRS